MPGINLGRIASIGTPDIIAASGAQGIRCTYHPSVSVLGGSTWLQSFRNRGMSTLLCLDNDSNFWEAPHVWQNGVERARDAYRNQVDYWQVCNEPDAGYLAPGVDQSLEGRAAANPSSWVMSQDELSERLRVARDVLGPDAVIIGPGLSSGHADWADSVDWSPVTMLAVHAYAKEPGQKVADLLASYARFGKPVVVTEYEATKQGMHLWMAEHHVLSWAFCWTDAMVPGLGLTDENGNPKPQIMAEFIAANAIHQPESKPMTDPEAMDAARRDLWEANTKQPYDPNVLALCRYWTEHIDELGSPAGPERSADNGNVYQAFSNGVWVYWGDGSGTITKAA